MLLLVTVEGLSLLGVETVGIAFAATVVDTNLVASPVDDIYEFVTSDAVVTLLSIVVEITSTAAETTTESLLAEQFQMAFCPKDVCGVYYLKKNSWECAEIDLYDNSQFSSTISGK